MIMFNVDFPTNDELCADKKIQLEKILPPKAKIDDEHGSAVKTIMEDFCQPFDEQSDDNMDQPPQQCAQQ